MATKTLKNVTVSDAYLALLADRGPSAASAGVPTVPFCPIITQGWNFLRSRRVELHPVLREAQDALVPGPFTMFQPEQTERIVKAISSGEILEN